MDQQKIPSYGALRLNFAPAAYQRFFLIALLAIAYTIGGGIGLMLAVPPGYATVIWPASGLAVAGLLLHGRSLWPGIFLGSFVLNSMVGGAFENGTLKPVALFVALAIAGGSTLQAVLASEIARRKFGIPLKFSGIRDIFTFTIMTGPLSCLVAATIGVTTLYVAGVLPASAVVENWLTWWTGDLVGVLVFLPLALLNPWRPWSVLWDGRAAPGFTIVTLLLAAVPLGLTFYAWKATSEFTFNRNQFAFESLAHDSELALKHRLNSYRQGLDGGAGLFHGSANVTREDWVNYIDALDISSTLPGINGLGFIAEVPADELDAFTRQTERDGISEFAVHPETPAPAIFAIKYIEPFSQNRQAVGLNIAFEENRYNAAVSSRDTGRPTITRRIFLVQDSTRSAGFLLLRPMYAHGAPIRTVQQRRDAFQGWIYAPFVSHLFLDGLTSSQGKTLNIEVYDGPVANADQVIFASNSGEPRASAPAYSVTETVYIMEQTWTIVWSSTREFEKSVNGSEAAVVLGSGISLSLLFGALIMSVTRREASVRRIVAEQTSAIAAREQLNRSIVDYATVGIAVLNEDGIIISANNATEVIFGCKNADIIGQTLENLILPDAPVAMEGLIPEQKEIETGTPRRSTRMHGLKSDGTDLYLDLQVNSWSTEAGAVRHTAIIRDISYEHEISTALEAAEKRWQFALRGANMGVFDLDLAHGTAFVSDTWKTMLGFDAKERIDPQREWMSRLHPDDHAQVMAINQDCLKGKTQKTESEYRIRSKDGRWLWLRSEAIVTERDTQGVALRFVGTQVDITDLKFAEAALKTSEERFRSAIEHAPIGMAIVGLDGNWMNVNEALCDFLGYTEAELLELDFRAITHPDEIATDQAYMDQLIKRELPTYEREKRYIHKGGHELWGLLRVSMARDIDGNPEYFISQIQDINARKNMDRIKGDFIATVSHELRTPLTSIRGSLGLVTGSMSKDLPENVTRMLSIAFKNCERLISLINDILDLEKIASGHVQLNCIPESVAEIVEHAIEANQAFADQFQVAIKVTGAASDMRVSVDPGRVQQVLANLLSNAAKFSPQGSEVTVSIEKRGDRVRLGIADTGQGIPSEFRASIFERFTQADTSATRSVGGTGLGLHISKQLVEQMNGTIGFNSVVDKGTTFWVEFPLENTLLEPSLLQTYDEAKASGLPLALHMEDDTDFSEVLAAGLRDHIRIVNVISCAQAKKFLESRHFDLMIVDVELPDQNGLTLLEDGSPLRDDMPVVIISASDHLVSDERICGIVVKARTPESEMIGMLIEIAAELAASKAV